MSPWDAARERRRTASGYRHGIATGGGHGMEYLGLAILLLFVWGVVWMARVGRSGPPVLNALAETAVLLAFPVGLVVWWVLRRRDRMAR